MPAPAPDDVLFDDEARRLAAAQPDEAPFRWLALSPDPEAAHLRAALERGFRRALPPAATRLRNGLATARWGQHVGALAHLLLLALYDATGCALAVDPPLDGQHPDALVERDGQRALVEVRAITGMGRQPWRRRAERPRPDADADARTAAALRRVLGDVLLEKAGSYAGLVRRRALPYLVVLYADTDPGLAPLLRDVAFGPAAEQPRRDDRWGQAPDGGLFAARRAELAGVSAAAVFGRCDDDDGVLRLTGELLVNPFAERPLPVALRPTFWRVLDVEAPPAGDAAPDVRAARPAPRMLWTGPPPPPLELHA